MTKIIGTTLGILGYVIQAVTRTSLIPFKLYQLAEKYDNRSISSLAAYGILLLKREKPEVSLSQFEKMKDITKKDYFKKIAYKNMALCYWKLERIDDAIDILDRLRNKTAAVDKDLYTSLAYFHLLKANYQKALDFSNKVLDKDSNHASALDNIGQVYFEQDKLKKAEPYFLKALNNKKNMVDSKYYLGLIYEKWGEKEKAEKYFKKAYETSISSFSTVNKKEIEEKCREYNVFEGG